MTESRSRLRFLLETAHRASVYNGLDMRKPVPSLRWESPFWVCSLCVWKELGPKALTRRSLNDPEASPEIVGAFLEHRCARYPREPRKEEVIPSTHSVHP
jgi:hypothetical protein